MKTQVPTVLWEKSIHNILDGRLWQVQNALEKELAAITLADINKDTEKYIHEKNH